MHKPRPRATNVSFPLPLRYVVTKIVADAVLSSVAIEFDRADIVVRWYRRLRQVCPRCVHRRIGPIASNWIEWFVCCDGRLEQSFRTDKKGHKGSCPSPGSLLRGL